MKIGILGGGQLAQMIALSGIPLGLRFVCYDPVDDCCASTVAEHISADYDNRKKLAEFAGQVDIITYEFENVPASCVRYLNALMQEKGSAVFPGENALHATQDRLREKQLFEKLAIPTPAFMAVNHAEDLEQAVRLLGLPLVLKSRSGGYDGKGQSVIRNEHDLHEAKKAIKHDQLIAEAWVNFDREISIIAVRSRSGQTAFYDIAENTHQNGILSTSFNRPDDAMQKKAEMLAQRLLDELNYTGVIALELFQTGDQLFANEYAPRVHNTGHWTIEGAACSQFENHLRALLDWPVGSTRSIGYSGMINFIGELPPVSDYLSVNNAHYHDYGKEPRPGRKVGHATLVAASQDSVKKMTETLEAQNRGLARQ
ncbi:MAG: 5-(carboxyamino)imidazole ribonucleotide synthase [Pseudomonadales bacterium]|nr:5-(carboxyamino)imidazole ribonucleotide synthase [Pseudomonadales bacterium]